MTDCDTKGGEFEGATESLSQLLVEIVFDYYKKCLIAIQIPILEPVYSAALGRGIFDTLITGQLSICCYLV